MCCTWLGKNTGRKNDAKNRHLGTIPQLCHGYIFATEACIDNRKKLLNIDTSSTCPDNTVNFGLLAGAVSYTHLTLPTIYSV